MQHKKDVSWEQVTKAVDATSPEIKTEPEVRKEWFNL